MIALFTKASQYNKNFAYKHLARENGEWQWVTGGPDMTWVDGRLYWVTGVWEMMRGDSDSG